MWIAAASLIGVLLFGLSSPAGASELEPLDIYTQKLKPRFQKSCYPCHGALKQEAGLRVDTVASMRESGLLDMEAPDESELLARVGTDDADLRMPPPHEGERFETEELVWLTEWMAAGAPAPSDERPEEDPADHWSFRPIQRPAVPNVAEPSMRIRNPIDAFIARGHARAGVRAQGEVDGVTLTRRTYFDLLGLPPAGEAEGLQGSDNTELTQEQLVDRLLDDPRHGQRWARHWMDVWRYSDWWGLNAQLRNSQRHMWHWRDWIVESLNEDLPYDEMVRCMLAADELYPADFERARATGFLARNYFLFNRNQWMEETVEHVGKGLLGLTLNCAKCHDHKYDPIAQRDFYRMRAFFEPYHVRQDFVEGALDVNQDGVPRVYDGELDTPTYRFIRGEEGNIDDSEVMEPNVPELLRFAALEIEAIDLPPEAYDPARRDWVLPAYQAEAEAKVTAAKQKLETLKAQVQSEDAAEAAKVTEAVLREAARAWDVAMAESQWVEARIAYQRASWEQQPAEMSARARELGDLAEDVVRCERRLAWARTRLATAAARKSWEETQSLAADDKKCQDAAKALDTAQQKQAETLATLSAPIPADYQPQPFVGAQWSATRFQHSGRDDPAVAFPPRSTGRRTALAEWITDRRNPLTARVAVNHVWTRHMGKPLVASVFDFGRAGAAPTHPELLDWLAAEFIESGWSFKHLHRLITTSTTYRLQSTTLGNSEAQQIDASNRWWWRREPMRLESQVVRDAVLQLAGQLECRLGGPAVPTAAQAKSNRRSLYFFHSKNDRNLFLTTFDEARVTDCYRRETSVVPQQALAMSNSELTLEAAPKIAARLSTFADDEDSFIRLAFTELLGAEPTAGEWEAVKQAMGEWAKVAEQEPERGREWLVWTLLNHNDFVTVR